MTMDDYDLEATAKLPRPQGEFHLPDDEVDPERTVVGEDWETAVIRKVAPRVQEVQSTIGEEQDEAAFGWESAVLRRLSKEVARY